jgi:hypothetical protein
MAFSNSVSIEKDYVREVSAVHHPSQGISTELLQNHCTPDNTINSSN